MRSEISADLLVEAPANSVDAVDSADVERETVNAVLAEQARGHTSGTLWRTALGGAMNAILVWTQFPSMQWLASGFTAVAAYGLWGLIDARIREVETGVARGNVVFARGLRVFTAIGGWTAALFAVVAFMRFLVRGWIS